MRIDRGFLLKELESIINVPSAVGYYDEIHPYLEGKIKELGYEDISYDLKRTLYVSVEGEDNSKTICLGAHLDTIGLMVRNINKDDTLSLRQLGGVNFSSIEGESVFIYTRDGRTYTGMVICKSHSVHVFDDARSLERNEDNMLVILDKLVSSREEVEELGIMHGDTISVEPGYVYTEEGFIKSRHIDDKAAVAALLYALKYFKENNIKPKYKVLMAFPIYEEIGHGGAYVPEEVSEYIAIDIGLIGPQYNGSETKVSICAKDAYSPYDRGLTTKLINLAKEKGIDFCVDIFYRYGTDATAAIRSGNNLLHGAFGMGCINTHGKERCHITSIEETAKLIIAYMLSE